MAEIARFYVHKLPSMLRVPIDQIDKDTPMQADMIRLGCNHYAHIAPIPFGMSQTVLRQVEARLVSHWWAGRKHKCYCRIEVKFDEHGLCSN